MRLSLGEKLIYSCALGKDYSTIASVNTDWLDGRELLAMQEFKDYFKSNKKTPPLSVLNSKLGISVKPTDVGATPNYYLKEVKNRFIFKELSIRVPKTMKDVKSNPVKVLEELKTICSEAGIDTKDTRIIGYENDALKRYSDYQDRKKNKGITYLSTGVETLDNIFYGYHKADLITIAARAGLGKTFFISQLAILVEEQIMERDLGDILFISNEMPASELFLRLDAIRYSLPYPDLMTGQLSEHDESRYQKNLKFLESPIQVLEKVKTIEELDDLISIYNPSIVFIDGSYLMEGQSRLQTWERIQKITQGLKDSALRHQVPIINTTQLKRGSGKKSTDFSLDAQEDFAFGGSYIQDSDVAIPLYQDKDMKWRHEVGGEFAKLRRGSTEEKFVWDFNLYTMGFQILPQEEDLIINGDSPVF